jgi:hypothetical protein
MREEGHKKNRKGRRRRRKERQNGKINLPLGFGQTNIAAAAAAGLLHIAASLECVMMHLRTDRPTDRPKEEEEEEEGHHYHHHHLHQLRHCVRGRLPRAQFR